MSSPMMLPSSACPEAPAGPISPSLSLWPPTPTPHAAFLAFAPSFVQQSSEWSCPEQRLAPAPPPHRAPLQSDALIGDAARQPLKVRNTFIDGFADEDEDGPLGMAACKSWHVGCLPTRDKPELSIRHSLRESAGESSEQDATTLPSTAWDELTTTSVPSERYASEIGSIASAPCDHCVFEIGSITSEVRSVPPHIGRAFSVAPALFDRYTELCAAAPEPPAPEGLRRPEASVGAALHGTGQCRQCAWFWKPEGCSHGADCGHCNMCPAGELKERKKAKAQVLRSFRSEAQAPRSFRSERPARTAW